MARGYPIPAKARIITGYNVITAKGGKAKEFGLGEKATEENIREYKRQALRWAEDNISTYGELYVVEVFQGMNRVKRFYTPIPENVHPMSSHLAHRHRPDLDIPPMAAKAQLG